MLKFPIIRYLIFQVEVKIILFLKRGPFRIPQIKVTLPCLFFFLFLVVLKDFHSVVIEVYVKSVCLSMLKQIFIDYSTCKILCYVIYSNKER